MVHGELKIDGVGSGLVDLKITPNSYELTAEAKLFDAFWAYLDANMTIVPPTYQAHGELKAEFGTAIASALENPMRDLRALLATLDQLYADFQDQNKDLDDLTDSLLNLGSTLKANGAEGPLIDLMAAFASELRKAKAAAEAIGIYPSLDQIVNYILQGATITITDGVPGYWVYPECIGVYYKGKCYGVWIPSEKTCITYYDGSTCWLIPPIKFHYSRNLPRHHQSPGLRLFMRLSGPQEPGRRSRRRCFLPDLRRSHQHRPSGVGERGATRPL